MAVIHWTLQSYPMNVSLSVTHITLLERSSTPQHALNWWHNWYISREQKKISLAKGSKIKTPEPYSPVKVPLVIGSPLNFKLKGSNAKWTVARVRPVKSDQAVKSRKQPRKLGMRKDVTKMERWDSIFIHQNFNKSLCNIPVEKQRKMILGVLEDSS